MSVHISYTSFRADTTQFRADTTQVANNFHFRINSKDMGACKIILSSIMDEGSHILEYFVKIGVFLAKRGPQKSSNLHFLVIYVFYSS